MKDFTINCNGSLLQLNQPVIMGVLNITPDSFYSGSRYQTENEIVAQAQQMLNEGASILDVGAISTRPFADEISEADEIERLTMAFGALRKHFPSAILSVDTFRSAVARHVVSHFQVDIVNDISGGDFDSKMLETVADLKVPYVLMHIKGTPQTMQVKPHYDNLLQEMFLYFSDRVNRLKLLGVNDIILDLGFGFGKTIEHNYQLINHFQDFMIFGLPILAGLSRKSMIFRFLNITPEESLNGTTVLNTIALQKGANILRVHDVKEASETIKLISKLNENNFRF